MRRRFLNLCKFSLVALFSVILISAVSTRQAESYYGGYSGLSSLYSGLYGMGGLYGMSGMYGMMGGLYGMSGMYGMMGGLYGMSGMYGMGGSSSLYSPFGLQNMYYTVNTGGGLSYQVPFLQIAPYLGMAGLYNSLFPSVFGSSYSSYGRAAQQVITALYSALVADLVIGPILLADTVTLNILAADAVLAAVVAADALWLSLHTWQVVPPTIPVAQPLLLSKIAVSCTQCHINPTAGTLLPVVPLPTQLI